MPTLIANLWRFTPSSAGIRKVRDIRDVQVTDLLGRHQIDTDLDSIAGYLTGRRVLLTGAGGSITVIHPGVTRFFMTLHEAVHPVIQAAAIGRGGEALKSRVCGPRRFA